MSFVFISYSRKDAEKVSAVADGLRAANIPVWLDEDLETGNPDSFQKELQDRIAEADLVAVCWTRHSIRSLFVLAEATCAMESKKLFPIRLDDSTLPLPFNAVHTQNLTGWNGDARDDQWQRCLKALRQNIWTRSGDPTERSARAYLGVVHRLTGFDLSDGPIQGLRDFTKCRWEALGLLVAVQALIPDVPESSLAYWNSVFNSGHFVPDEIVGHHSKQSLAMIRDLAANIAASAEAASAALETADVPPQEFGRRSTGDA